MKKITTLLLATLISLSAIAQQPYKVYCSVWGNNATGSTMGYAYIDYGQQDMARNWLVDSSGKGIYFNSVIGVLNHLSKYGWQLEAAFDTQTPRLSDSTKYDTRQVLFLSKMVTSDEEITEGIYTKNMYKNR